MQQEKDHQAFPNVCIALPGNSSAQSWSHNNGQPNQEFNMESAICPKNKQELGKVVHVYNPNAQ